MSTAYRPNLERLRYWQGQSLRSLDARDQQRFDALRRRLHNRALHSTDGVAFGLAVRIASDDPQAVEVACGLAYDMRGQELILQRTRRLALPTAPGTQVLRLKLRATAGGGADAGLAPDARLLEQAVELAWVAAAAVNRASDVLLARFHAGSLDEQYLPRQARPIARPRLATGATVPGNTAWEPWELERVDASGAIVKLVVGVQTYIDTSASGFTLTPRYVASLQTQLPSWDQHSADFAPAFFANVGAAAADGFTFRLLMTEVARRRYSAWSGIGRVAEIKRALGERLEVRVDAQAAFKVGDVIAQLRPRAHDVVALESIDGDALTLAAPLETGVKSLAVGNLPRMAAVEKVIADDPTVLATFQATQAVAEGDLLQRTVDSALARVDAVSDGTLSVGDPFDGWVATDELTLVRMSASVGVKQTGVSDANSLTLKLGKTKHHVEIGMSIALLNAENVPLATVTVTSHTGADIEALPLPSAAERQHVAQVVPLAQISVSSLQAKSANTIVLLTVSGFRKDDFVIAADQPSKIARVTNFDEKTRQMQLSEALDVKPASLIVGANWQSATTVDVFDPTMPTQVTVGRRHAALAGDFVVLRTGDQFAKPVLVASVADKTLTLAAALVGAAPLAILACGRFPRVATVLMQDVEGASVVIAEAGALHPGDCVLVEPKAVPAPATRAVLQVVSVAGTAVLLSASPGLLLPGDQLKTVHWRDLVQVLAVDAGTPTQIEVDRGEGLRPGDLLGKLVYFSDCSSPGYVEKISGNVLTLLPGREYADGIVPTGWIDGGIVGPAAVCLPAAPVPSFPQWQPFVRFDTLQGLDERLPATAYGFDLNTGKYQSRTVSPAIPDPGGTHLLFLIHGHEPYRFRPETLSLITGFNDDFPRAFASFAQKQQLVVRWIGCQDELAGERPCPAQGPYNACGPAAPATLSEDS